MKRKSCYSSLKNVGARFVKGSPVTLWKENRNSAHNSSSAQLSSARILIKKSLCLDASEEAPQEIRETPSTIANGIRCWLRQNRTVAVAFFAKEIVKHSQGTVSSLLSKPPWSFPTGAVREPWESMKNFLSNPEEKAKLLDQLKARKGEHFTDFALKYKNSRNKHLSIWNISPFVIWTGKGKQTGETAESQETAPPKKKTRKIFDKVELASLDAVYQASNGLPTNTMVERLANSLDMTKNQVIIPSSWTLYSAWFKLTFRLWSLYVVFII